MQASAEDLVYEPGGVKKSDGIFTLFTARRGC